MSEPIRKAKRVSIVANLMGCDRRTVVRMVQDGRLAGYKLGKLIYVYLDSIEKYRETYRFGAGGIDSAAKN